MSSLDGSLARMLDFDGSPARAGSATGETTACRSIPNGVRPEPLVPDGPTPSGSHLRSWAVRSPAGRRAREARGSAIVPHGPGKYRTLERRRRMAQINARHLLDLPD